MKCLACMYQYVLNLKGGNKFILKHTFIAGSTMVLRELI